MIDTTHMGDVDDVELRAVYDDLLLVPVIDPLAAGSGYSSQGYVVLIEGRAVLIDILGSYHRPIVAKLREAGREPVLVVLTHGHLLGDRSAPGLFERELGIPIFLHPKDASASRQAADGARFGDPTTAAAFAALGIEVISFAGHTAGHILLVWGAHGGVVFAGDSAMGTSFAERGAGRTELLRPPLSFNEDDELLRRNWEAFDRRVASILPLHGQGIVGRPDAVDAGLASLRRASPTPELIH